VEKLLTAEHLKQLDPLVNNTPRAAQIMPSVPKLHRIVEHKMLPMPCCQMPAASPVSCCINKMCYNGNVTYVMCCYVVVQGPEVRSGDLAEPIILERGQHYTFTITEGEDRLCAVQ
jgi:hypothetical protein